MAYYCLHQFHWKPSEFLGLPRRERAFIAAAVELRIEQEKKEQKKLKARKK